MAGPEQVVEGGVGVTEKTKKGGVEVTEGTKKVDPKAAKKAERLAARQAQSQASASKEEDDPLSGNYGDLPLVQSVEISGRKWSTIRSLTSEKEGEIVLVRARIHTNRGKGKMVFLVLREGGFTIQCVVSVGENVSKQMVKYVAGLSKETVVDIVGKVVKPAQEIDATTQKVELQSHSVHCVSRAAPAMPISLEDASRSEEEIERGEKEGVQYVRVNQDTRLNFRPIELRTPANQAIFRVQSAVGQLFRQYLLSLSFVEIHTPKLIAGASEGGSQVFSLLYKGGREACLAQSPQLHKQMAVMADFGRVFEIGPVFRAEDSFTHRHLCEFVGLDLEMEIKEHYFEVLDLVNSMFISIFDGLNSQFSAELEAINLQFPFEPLKYPKEGLKFSFAEGMALLKEEGYEVDEMSDINTEMEKKLGDIVKKRHGTDFYMMYRYPLGARAFYSMPCPDDPRYCNSFDVFIRGEEILSGAQRIHDADLLSSRAKACGIDVNTISTYIDSFRFGAFPHAGIGVGLERVVMLFCGLNNIRKTSMFPRDPQRLTP